MFRPWVRTVFLLVLLVVLAVLYLGGRREEPEIYQACVPPGESLAVLSGTTWRVFSWEPSGEQGVIVRSSASEPGFILTVGKERALTLSRSDNFQLVVLMEFRGIYGLRRAACFRSPHPLKPSE